MAAIFLDLMQISLTTIWLKFVLQAEYPRGCLDWKPLYDIRKYDKRLMIYI